MKNHQNPPLEKQTRTLIQSYCGAGKDVILVKNHPPYILAKGYE